MSREDVFASIHLLTDGVPTVATEANHSRIVIESIDQRARMVVTLTGGPEQRQAFAQALRDAADRIEGNE